MELNRNQKQQAEQLGGSDIEDWSEYEEWDWRLGHYSNKPAHAERSLFHSANHAEHWRKHKEP